MEDEKYLPAERYPSSDCPDGGYEVVRSQFFSQSTEPAVSFGRQKMWVNTICLKKFSGTDYIQILVNRDTKVLTLRPSQENARDALPWCSAGGGKRKPRKLSCPVFFAMVCALMKWDPGCRYRTAGKHLCENGAKLLAFDLRSAEAYACDAAMAQRYAARFPAGWGGRFGTPAAEHDIEPLVHIFDGYAVFKLEPPAVKPDTPAVQELEGEDEA